MSKPDAKSWVEVADDALVHAYALVPGDVLPKKVLTIRRLIAAVREQLE